MRGMTYDMEHDVVSQPGGAVDADQNPILDSGAEAHRQSVGPSAGPLVIGPCVGDKTSALSKDVRRSSCREE